MKIKSLIAALSVAACGTAAANDVGISISIGQPGFHGRIDLGAMPAPRLVYAEPIVVGHLHSHEPLYLHVPTRHIHHWSSYCDRYHACGRPVYFVDTHWYETIYVPTYRRHHDHHHDSAPRHHFKHKRKHYKTKHGHKGKRRGKSPRH